MARTLEQMEAEKESFKHPFGMPQQKNKCEYCGQTGETVWWFVDWQGTQKRVCETHYQRIMMNEISIKHLVAKFDGDK